MGGVELLKRPVYGNNGKFLGFTGFKPLFTFEQISVLSVSQRFIEAKT